MPKQDDLLERDFCLILFPFPISLAFLFYFIFLAMSETLLAKQVVGISFGSTPLVFRPTAGFGGPSHPNLHHVLHVIVHPSLEIKAQVSVPVG